MGNNPYEMLNWYYKVAYQTEYDVGTPQYVGWFDKEHQLKRFQTLLNIGVNKYHSILDYGCGIGDLIDYMDSKDIKPTYYGLDINDDYLEVAREKHPEKTFYAGDVTDISPTSQQVDWILASGVFSVMVPEEWLMSRLSICTRLVKKGIAFNLLKESEDPNQLIPYNPTEIKFKLIKEFPDFEIQLVEGYLDDDFTIYMKKRIMII